MAVDLLLATAGLPEPFCSDHSPLYRNAIMELNIENLPNDVSHLILIGKMDLAGAQQIDIRFSAATGSTRKALVDLSQVSFLASMGIRTLVLGAKNVQSKGGKMVFLKPSAEVAQVLTAAGIDTIVPIHQDLESALSALSA